MARRKQGYDAACQYDGKLMGRCTVADSEAYVAFMEQCGGSAARVLQEYAYFSPELKAILEKVAAIQAGQARKTGPAREAAPRKSPWGEIQTCDQLCPGVFMVSTAGHGGTMMAQDMTAALSPAARKCGTQHRGFLCFEQDSAESVVLRELLDKKLWRVPDRIKDRAAFEENINNVIREYHPEYWRSRQRGLEARQQAEARRSPERGAGDAR